MRGAIVAAVIGIGCAEGFPREIAQELRLERSAGLASRKGDPSADVQVRALLGTLVQTHTDERVPLDNVTPDEPRFDALLADRATGSSHALDPRLLALLRTLATTYAERGDAGGGAPRFELVSGFRSPKLNEMLRKKGHHVASHSQHSLGNAVDFRVVLPCASLDPLDPAAKDCTRFAALDPRTVETAIRATGWDGGVGTYTAKDDWFTHADVGPNRAWREGPAVTTGAAGATNREP